MLLAFEMVVLGLITFAAMIAFIRLCDWVQVMTMVSLLLSVAAFVYLVYAMLRPEKF